MLASQESVFRLCHFSADGSNMPHPSNASRLIRLLKPLRSLGFLRIVRALECHVPGTELPPLALTIETTLASAESNIMTMFLLVMTTLVWPLQERGNVYKNKIKRHDSAADGGFNIERRHSCIARELHMLVIGGRLI